MFTTAMASAPLISSLVMSSLSAAAPDGTARCAVAAGAS
jgi:hypothetical protein